MSPRRRLTTVLLVSACAAGVHRRVRVPRGDAAQDRAPRWEPAVLSAAADRLSQPPPAPGLAACWAAPLTMAGFLAGLAGATRPRRLSRAWLFAPTNGVTGRVLRATGFSGTGIGQVIICVDARPRPALLAHELAHVHQAERLGIAFPLAYLGLLALYGYARHPLERAARRMARNDH